MAPVTRSNKRKSLGHTHCDKTFDGSSILKPILHKRIVKNLCNNASSSTGSVSRNNVRGLINLGGSCYINSVIQVLIHTPPLRNYFLSEQHNCNEVHASVCQMCTLSNIFKEYYEGNVLPPMSLHRLLYLVWLETPSLAGLEQQDAHEFYMTYLQLLHDSCKLSENYFPYIPNAATNSSSSPCTCIIDQLYAGVLESNLKCLKCKSTSSKREIFYDISLQIDAYEMEDLYDCLKNYTTSENLNESSEIQCSTCASVQKFIKTLSFVILPNVLNINFKRFTQRFTQKGAEQKKLTNNVRFPFELKMAQFARGCSNDTTEEVYSLLAVICHAGSMNSGHYTVYVKESEDIWLLCNDHKIKPVTPDVVQGTEAYMLIYEKKR